MHRPEKVCLEGVHCTMTLETPAPGVIVVTVVGTDVGEHGERPFAILNRFLRNVHDAELFVDARRARGPAIAVSCDWAMWLTACRPHLLHVSMLTGSHLVQVSAGFVRSFATLHDLMRLYTDARVFEGALSNATHNAKALAAKRELECALPSKSSTLSLHTTC